MTTDLELQSDVVADIAELAMNAAMPAELKLGKYYVVTVGGQLHQINLTGDEYQDQPRRKKGTTVVRDVASFAAYYLKHSRLASEVYADRDKLTVTAVLDAPGALADETGWAQHRVVLQLRHSTAWQAWKAGNTRSMTQEEFAEHLEDNRADISTPSAAEMLEVAQSIQAATKVDFSASFRLADGQRRIAYTESVESKAGTRGELAIPAQIVLRLPVFQGAEGADLLTARFRHRLAGGQLRLSYHLDRPEDVVDSAFAGVVAEVTEQCATTVLTGTPA